MTMTTQEVTKAFAQLCADGKFGEAGERFWTDDIVSLEAMPGEMAELRGREAVLRKQAWWRENHEEHGCRVDGPYVHGNQFALRFLLDVTPKGQPRTTMDEVALYTVENSKVIEERFFY